MASWDHGIVASWHRGVWGAESGVQSRARGCHRQRPIPGAGVGGAVCALCAGGHEGHGRLAPPEMLAGRGTRVAPDRGAVAASPCKAAASGRVVERVDRGSCGATTCSAAEGGAASPPVGQEHGEVEVIDHAVGAEKGRKGVSTFSAPPCKAAAIGRVVERGDRRPPADSHAPPATTGRGFADQASGHHGIRRGAEKGMSTFSAEKGMSTFSASPCKTAAIGRVVERGDRKPPAESHAQPATTGRGFADQASWHQGITETRARCHHLKRSGRWCRVSPSWPGARRGRDD